MTGIAILLVEDDPDEAQVVQRLLNQHPVSNLTYVVTRAGTLGDALAILEKEQFSLVLANLSLPDSDGLETVTALLQAAPATPLIALNGHPDEAFALKVIAAGAQDYISKQAVSGPALFRIVHYAIERAHLLETLRSLSFTDELTDLYNRRGFRILAQQQIDLSTRTNRGFYLILIDLDHLKAINDKDGHLAGDRALIDTATCLKQTFRSTDIVARIGGDEFAIISLNATNGNEKTLRSHLEETLKTFPTISLSIGISFFDPNAPLPLDTLLHQADTNLYADKRS